MSFHISAEDITVDGHILRARLRNEGGDNVDAEINLDDYIGNNDGRFEWGGNGFSQTAEDIRFGIEGGGEVPVLRARLQNLEGEFVDADLNLAERISNEDGRFVFSYGSCPQALDRVFFPGSPAWQTHFLFRLIVTRGLLCFSSRIIDSYTTA
ncbi:hypothetical protein DL768_008951 [Monosporascus sp. mg162]|nr:hypothetical protein DL768_008951 [Monosporascus sp. mg162]